MDEKQSTTKGGSKPLKQNVGGGSVDIKGMLEVTHKLTVDIPAYAIFQILLSITGIFVGVVLTTFVTWLPYDIYAKIGIAIGPLILVFIVCWWLQYPIMKHIQKWPERYSCEKTYRGKSKIEAIKKWVLRLRRDKDAHTNHD